MLKHYFSIPSLVLRLAVALFPSTTSTAETFPANDFDGGDGSIDSPYEIANLAQLRRLSESAEEWRDVHFILTADIDATETNTWNVGDHDENPDTPDMAIGFLPIPNYYGTHATYAGNTPATFNGQGHVIKNLYINNRPGYVVSGLFSYIETVEISNLGLVDVDVTGTKYIGALAAKTNRYSKITNCNASGSVVSTGRYVGGLVGSLNFESTIINSYAAVTVSGYRGVGGLVGELLTGNNIEICTITNSYATGTVTGEQDTGGLVGYTAGGSIITDCYATGEVSGLTKSGGLVGWNRGSITTSYATGAVLGTSSTGGLVGTNTDGPITNCYATGSVSGNATSGGLIGVSARSTISASYASGFVKGNEYTGGLIGYNFFDDFGTPQNNTITACYWDINSSGQSFGSSDISGAGEIVGTGLTSAQMLQQSSFIGFDFSTPEWDIVEGQTHPYLPWQKVAIHEGTATTDRTSLTLTGGYVYNPIASTLDEYGIVLRENSTNTITYHPLGYDLSYDTGVSLNNVTVTDLDPSIAYLYNVYAIDAMGDIHVGTERYMTLESDPGTIIDFAYNGGNGSIDTPYQIATLEHLQQLSEWPNHFSRHFILTADIDATDTNTWNVGDHDNNPDTPDITSGFLPIGSITRPFTGTFDGHGHFIENLIINRPEDHGESVGFFGRVSGATISNLGIEGGSITGEGSVGGLIGKTSGSTIDNCYTTGSVSGHMNSIGGLIGYTNWDTVTDCYATGAVTGGDEYNGGLVGVLQNSSITNCFATGTVSGNKETGGLVGANIFSTITSSYATGSVTGNYMVGGLAGVNRGDSITNSYATGSVTNTASNENNKLTGGFVGHNYAIITNCYATGSVSGPEYTGGFAGFNYRAVSKLKCTDWVCE
jgi:hypothetical protein